MIVILRTVDIYMPITSFEISPFTNQDNISQINKQTPPENLILRKYLSPFEIRTL